MITSRKRSHSDLVEVPVVGLALPDNTDAIYANGTISGQKVARVEGKEGETQTYSLTVLNTNLPEPKPTGAPATPGTPETPKPKPRTKFVRKTQGVSVKYMCYDNTEKSLLASVMDPGTPMCKFSTRGELLEKAAVDSENFTGLTFCLDTRRGIIISGAYGKLQVLDKRDFKEKALIELPEEDYVISLAYSPAEDAYLVGDLEHNLWEVDAESHQVKQRVKLGDNIVPYHLCHNPLTSDIVVSDSASHQVHVIDKEGERVRTLGSTDGAGINQFHNPQAGSVDRDGHMLIPDYYNHRVLRCALDGSSDPFQVIVTSEQLEGGKPSHVTLTEDGNLFVAANDTSALYCFDYITE